MSLIDNDGFPNNLKMQNEVENVVLSLKPGTPLSISLITFQLVFLSIILIISPIVFQKEASFTFFALVFLPFILLTILTAGFILEIYFWPVYYNDFQDIYYKLYPFINHTMFWIFTYGILILASMTIQNPVGKQKNKSTLRNTYILLAFFLVLYTSKVIDQSWVVFLVQNGPLLLYPLITCHLLNHILKFKNSSHFVRIVDDLNEISMLKAKIIGNFILILIGGCDYISVYYMEKYGVQNNLSFYYWFQLHDALFPLIMTIVLIGCVQSLRMSLFGCCYNSNKTVEVVAQAENRVTPIPPPEWVYNYLNTMGFVNVNHNSPPPSYFMPGMLLPYIDNTTGQQIMMHPPLPPPSYQALPNMVIPRQEESSNPDEDSARIFSRSTSQQNSTSAQSSVYFGSTTSLQNDSNNAQPLEPSEPPEPTNEVIVISRPPLVISSASMSRNVRSDLPPVV